MATAMYLEHYLDSLESLPTELQRNFTLMRDLDTRSQDLLKQIDNMADDYVKTVRSMPGEKRSENLGQIGKLFGKSKEYGDDKVQLAMQTYELVDKHIRRLDADLARFEAELKEKAINNNNGKGADGKKGNKKKRNEKKEDIEDEIPKKKKSRKSPPLDSEPETAPVIVPVLPLASITGASDVLDMPVDPNEPTYCLCHQVSYGEMIGCDNPDCPIEWFHFACVGLTTKPKGKWFCPRCIAERKKNK